MLVDSVTVASVMEVSSSSSLDSDELSEDDDSPARLPRPLNFCFLMA